MMCGCNAVNALCTLILVGTFFIIGLNQLIGKSSKTGGYLIEKK